MRRSPATLGAVALITGPFVLAFFSGGFFDRPRIVAGLVAWALVAVAVLVAPQPLPSSRAGRVALGGLALLCVWTALSIIWSPIAGRAQDDLQRLVLYLGFFIAAIALLRAEQTRRPLEPLLVLGAFVVVAYGLSERLVPDLIELSRSRTSAGRLEQPISYWNALGAVAAIGFVMAVRVSGDVDRPRLVRMAAAASGVTLGLGIYLSFSRGALAAAAAGLLVLLALAPSGRAQLRSALLVSGLAALAALLATAFDSVQSLELGEQGDSGEGLQMLLALIGLSLAAAVAVPRRGRLRLPSPTLGVSRPVAVLGSAVIVVVAATAAVAVFDGRPEVTSPAPGADPERFRSVDTNRYRYWEVAGRAWMDEPIAGVGSGGFQVRWLRERDRVDSSGDAHSLYIETAAELGLVGLGCLALFLGGIAVAVARLCRVSPATGAGIAAGLVVWAVHAGLDWDWEMPAVTLPALLLAAAAIAWWENDPALAAAPVNGRE